MHEDEKKYLRELLAKYPDIGEKIVRGTEEKEGQPPEISSGTDSIVVNSGVKEADRLADLIDKNLRDQEWNKRAVVAGIAVSAAGVIVGAPTLYDALTKPDEFHKIDPYWISQFWEMSEDEGLLTAELQKLQSDRNIKAELVSRLLAHNKGVVARESLTFWQKAISNNSDASVSDFLKFQLARDYHWLGQADEAVRTLDRMSNEAKSGFPYRLQMINSTFATLSKEYYRSSDSPPFAKYRRHLENIKPSISSSSGTMTAASIRTAAKELGIAAIYAGFFISLHEASQNTLTLSQRRKSWEDIGRLLDEVTSSENGEPTTFLKAAWYPLILVQVAALQNGDVEFAKRVSHTVGDFESWRHRDALRKQVQQYETYSSVQLTIKRINDALTCKNTGDFTGLWKHLEHIKKVEKHVEIPYVLRSIDYLWNKKEYAPENLDVTRRHFIGVTRRHFNRAGSHANYIAYVT